MLPDGSLIWVLIILVITTHQPAKAEFQSQRGDVNADLSTEGQNIRQNQVALQVSCVLKLRRATGTWHLEIPIASLHSPHTAPYLEARGKLEVGV